jgi:hypothetical protein
VAAGSSRRRAGRRAGGRLAGALLVLGCLGTVAPYAGRALGLVVDTRAIVEVLDHVVPGALVMAVGGYGTLRGRLPLPVALLATLAGFWMAATHLPLLAQVGDGRAELGAALFHSLPGIGVLAVAIGTAVLAWSDDDGLR